MLRGPRSRGDPEHDGRTDAPRRTAPSRQRPPKTLRIASFNVNRTQHSQTLPNGNQIADLGSYVKDDGSSGQIGSGLCMLVFRQHDAGVRVLLLRFVGHQPQQQQAQ